MKSVISVVCQVVNYMLVLARWYQGSYFQFLSRLSTCTTTYAFGTDSARNV